MPQEKPAFAFRPEVPLAKAIENYAEERELSKSDACRELVREGLKADELRDELEEVRDRLEAVENQQAQGFWGRLLS